MSKRSNFSKKKSTMETSKKALWITCLLFTSILIFGLIFTYMGDKDTTFFIYAIPSTGAVFGATVTFYLNKAKMENVFKGKIAFLEYKLELLKEQPPELHDIINTEIDGIDNTLSQSIDSTLQEAVDKTIDVSNTI